MRRLPSLTILISIVVQLYHVDAEHHLETLHGLHRHHLRNSSVSYFPSFAIDYDNAQFLLDGKPFRYISGSIHYFRIHHDQWEDRLRRIRALGFNAIQFYIPWNFHETAEKSFHFDVQRDFVKFIKVAEKLGLYSLVRVGPYICAEWENGGLPWWLLKRSNIKMRTNDPKYTSAVERWFAELLPRLKPLMRHNGGSVLMVQIENEYGSFSGCDNRYTEWLRDLAKQHLGDKTVLYTTDGGSEGYLKCGVIKDVFPTVDFGPQSRGDIDKAFAAQRKYLPCGKGPLVNSEFYPGWLALWGQKSQSLQSVEEMLNSTRYMHSLNASFNFYMIHGGTNFGFWNGAEPNAAVITSYDYSAPITEAGDITSAYLEIRNFIKSIPDWQNKPQDVPVNNKKLAYGDIKMEHVASATDLPSNNCAQSRFPLSFEEMNHGLGFMVYTTSLEKCGCNLTIPDFKDIAYVFIAEEYVGTLHRLRNQTDLIIRKCQVGDELNILVENHGRQTYETINDYKGILSDVLMDGQPLKQWSMCTINLGKQLHKMVEKRLRHPTVGANQKNNKFLHGVFTGTFHAEKSADTFLDFTNWGKGVLIVNGHILGRYWSIGPQISLYVPAPFIKVGDNRIIIVELEPDHFGCGETCVLPSVDKPIWKWEKRTSKWEKHLRYLLKIYKRNYERYFIE